MNDAPTREPRPGYAAARPKAFVDAVVAIAMTLLILPLMESVGDAATSGDDAFTWLLEHRDQLISFALSFVIIAMFWLSHHRLFSEVQRITNALLWLLVAWMFSIVWLPVATAMSGQMSADDTGARVIYVGSMIVTSLLSLATRVYLQRHPLLHEITPRSIRAGMVDDIAMAGLFVIALALILVFPTLGYYPMFIMFLNGPAQRLLNRLLRVDRLV